MDGSIESGFVGGKGEKQTLQTSPDALPGRSQIRSREDRSPPAKAKARKSSDSTIGALGQTYGQVLHGGGRRSINPAPFSPIAGSSNAYTPGLMRLARLIGGGMGDTN